ncbi:unnamed protein product [Meganyctiphanes norvegica]|uniref:Right handed beta helix domain-containing protein n=1 Tax=Meganyctiphanes norvegica TaxID=48144 RepID=A0AAV2Q0P7_MEGNR
MKALYSLCLVLFILPGSIKGKKHQLYVVDGNKGDDSNSGENSHHAFKTIQRCVDKLMIGQPGDQCRIREGRYHEVIYINGLTGIEGSPFVITGFEDEIPIWDGTIPIQPEQWDLDEETGICSATIDQDIIALFLDDDLLTAARWPNALWSDKTVFNNSFWGHCAEDSTPGNLIDDGRAGLAESGIDATGAMAILNIGSYITWSRPVLHHEPGSNSFTYNHDMSENHWNKVHNQYYFEAHLGLLDIPGEWFYDMNTKKLYVIPPSGDCPDPSTTSLRGRTEDYGLDITNSTWVTLSNLTFFGAGLTAHSIEGIHSHIDEITIDSVQLKFPSSSRRMLGDYEPPPSQFYVIAKATVEHHEKVFGRVSVINCTVEGSEGNPLAYAGNNCYIHNNYFGYNDWTCVLDTNYASIHGDGEGNEFSRNNLYFNGNSVGFRPGYFTTVKENHIWGQNSGEIQNDGASFQVGVPSQPGVHVINNWIHDTPKSAVRFDGGGQHMGFNGEVGHNVAWKSGGIVIKGDNHTIVNNLAMDKDREERCSLCVIYKLRHDAVIENNNTIVLNNGASLANGGIHVGTDGDSWPMGGKIVENNLSDMEIKNYMVDPDNWDFRPLEDGALNNGTEVKGPYQPGFSLTYWIPGRRLYKTSTPVPPSDSSVSYLRDAVMFLEAHDFDDHEFYLGTDESSVDSATLDDNEFQYSLQDGNVFMLPDLSPNTQYFWKVDTRWGEYHYKGDVWNFITYE